MEHASIKKPIGLVKISAEFLIFAVLRPLKQRGEDRFVFFGDNRSVFTVSPFEKSDTLGRRNGMNTVRKR